jgi:hypothetical protein
MTLVFLGYFTTASRADTAKNGNNQETPSDSCNNVPDHVPSHHAVISTDFVLLPIVAIFTLFAGPFFAIEVFATIIILHAIPIEHSSGRIPVAFVLVMGIFEVGSSWAESLTKVNAVISSEFVLLHFHVIITLFAG